MDAGGAASAGAWRAYNDSWVRSASAADAVNSEAYVLFYHRRYGIFCVVSLVAVQLLLQPLSRLFLALVMPVP